MPRAQPVFEQLEPLEMLTASTSSAAVSSSPVTLFVTFVDLVSTNDQDVIRLTNESDATARFAMELNGNISVNVHDLVDQIRAYEVAGDPGMPDYEKAYHYFMEFNTHDLPVSIDFWAHEPSLYLNSIGAGLCDDAASALTLIWNAMGYEARVWLLSGHVVSEVYTGERWQMYDADLGVVYYNYDNQVAGVEELADNPHLIYNPIVRFDSPTGVNHSYRTASFYWTTEDNHVCSWCTDNIEQHDLIFEIPSGGSLEIGEITPEVELPNSSVDIANLGLVTVTIPADSTGSLDIALVVYDVVVGAEDVILVGNESVALSAGEPFSYVHEATPETPVKSIKYSNNEQPIQVHYLINKKLSKLLDQNRVDLTYVDGPTEISAEIVSASIVNVQAATSNWAVMAEHYFARELPRAIKDEELVMLSIAEDEDEQLISESARRE